MSMLALLGGSHGWFTLDVPTDDYFGKLVEGDYLLLILERRNIRVNVGFTRRYGDWEVDQFQARPGGSLIGDHDFYRAIRILESTLFEHVGNATEPPPQRRTPVAKRRSLSS
jgi:hypothetical protein